MCDYSNGDVYNPQVSLETIRSYLLTVDAKSPSYYQTDDNSILFIFVLS